MTPDAKLAFMALDGLPQEEQVEIAQHCMEIVHKVPDLDPTDALVVLHKLGRYFNENAGVKK